MHVDQLAFLEAWCHAVAPDIESVDSGRARQAWRPAPAIDDGADVELKRASGSAGGGAVDLDVLGQIDPGCDLWQRLACDESRD